MKTGRNTTYPYPHTVAFGGAADEPVDRSALIDAILSDIGVPECLPPKEPPTGTVRESHCDSRRAGGPVCHIVAGANGAGKSTFALHFLPRYAECLEFVNPDLIALGLSPFDATRAAVRAGRLVLERIASLSAMKKDFGFESTLAGLGYLKLLKSLRSTGYRLHLYYLWIPGCELLIPRIRQRVATGGHSVPDQDVRRRYERSLKNFEAYAAVMDKIRIFDSSGMKPVLVYEKNGGALVYDAVRFAQMKMEVAL
jgi:predicted ABC-type ATPase